MTILRDILLVLGALQGVVILVVLAAVLTWWLRGCPD